MKRLIAVVACIWVVVIAYCLVSSFFVANAITTPQREKLVIAKESSFDMQKEVDEDLENNKEVAKKIETNIKETQDISESEEFAEPDNYDYEIANDDEVDDEYDDWDYLNSEGYQEDNFDVVSSEDDFVEWDGSVITPEGGVNNGPSGFETYYNLPMNVVIDVARENGYEGEEWTREDGAKMLGDYIMVAADYDTHPYGSTVETSLGTGIVVDTGDFIYDNPYQIDIAVDW